MRKGTSGFDFVKNYQADTLEEVLKLAGYEGDALETAIKSVECCNELCKKGADEGSCVLCAKENCAIRVALLEDARKRCELQLGQQEPGKENSAAVEEEIREQIELLDEEIAFYRSNAGKGLVYRQPEEILDDVIQPAPNAPGEVILLTDTFCETEGEQFAAMCQRCREKVRTIGRPTMGTLDYYDNINLQVHKHIILSYPIRMSKAAYEGRGISEKGLPVDEYIPWTPEELERDVILERAVSMD